MVETLHQAEIDWGSECYYAVGESVLPSVDEEPNRDKAYQKAKGYGRMKAVANLLTAVRQTPVSYNAAGANYLDTDNQLERAVEESAANAVIVEDRTRIDGSETVVAVTVRGAMYGPEAPASAILRARFQQGPQEDTARVKVEKQRDAASDATSTGAQPPFTSLIVDCSGLDVERSMSPKIRKADGSEIWGTLTVDYDFLQDRGIVAYAQNIGEAKKCDRAGSNPLVIKAVGRAGSRFMCDAVISDSDADLALKQNQASHFLDEFDVIFVVDAG